MESFIDEIPLVEFFILLTILMIGSIGLQALQQKKYLGHEDKKFLIKWISRGLIFLASIAMILKVIELITKHYPRIP